MKIEFASSEEDGITCAFLGVGKEMRNLICLNGCVMDACGINKKINKYEQL